MLQRSKSYQIEHTCIYIYTNIHTEAHTHIQIHFNNVCVLMSPGNIERKLGCRKTMEQVYDLWQTGYEKLIKNDQVHHPLFTLNYCHFTIWWTVIKIQSFSKQKLPSHSLIFCLFTVYFSLHLIYNWNSMRLHSHNVCITPRFLLLSLLLFSLLRIVFLSLSSMSRHIDDVTDIY